MEHSPATVVPEGMLWRVARNGQGDRFSRISAVEADGTGGNRFDVPGGGVLYCGSSKIACYFETLARFRVATPEGALNPAALAASKDSQFMQPGAIPRQWREERRVFRIDLEDPLPFIDIESEETRAYLAKTIPQTLARHDAQQLDVSDVRGKDRLLTRALAQHFFVEIAENGLPRYSGIRYMSRHGNHECWAVFEGTPLAINSMEPVELHDEDIREVSSLWGLTIH